MKILKIIGIVVVVLVVLFFGVAMFLPSSVHVERSLVLPASSELIYNEIIDLRQWHKWSPWHQQDPDMTITYDGRLKGEGGSYRWTSDKVGNGSLTIIEARPYQYIATDLKFMEQGQATGYYRLEPIDEGTIVTWGFETNMGQTPIAKYMGLMMDNMVGSDFEHGLQRLKTHIQSLQPKTAATET